MFNKKTTDENQVIEKDGKVYEVKEVRPNKKGKGCLTILGIVVIIGIIVNLFGSDPNSTNQVATTSSNSQIEGINTSSNAISTNNNINNTSEDPKLPIEAIKGLLDSQFSETADITYNSDDKVFLFNLKGDVATAVSTYMLYPDNADLKKSWESVREGFISMSESIRDNYSPGVQIHILNPSNNENVIFSIMDGIIFYDLFEQ